MGLQTLQVPRFFSITRGEGYGNRRVYGYKGTSPWQFPLWIGDASVVGASFGARLLTVRYPMSECLAAVGTTVQAFSANSGRRTDGR
jgi:hypothetical protein